MLRERNGPCCGPRDGYEFCGPEIGAGSGIEYPISGVEKSLLSRIQSQLEVAEIALTFLSKNQISNRE